MRHALLAILLLIVTVAAGASAGGPAERSTEPDDDVVREVVRMLDAGVAGDVVLRWLQRETRSPKSLSPNDVIALTEAGASPQLMDRLLEKPRNPRQPPLPRRPKPSPDAVPQPATESVSLTVSIRYRPYRDPEADEDEQWHLFAYLDGRPLAWSDGKSWLSRSKRNRVVSVEVPSGEHVIRIAQERHRRRGEGWWHEARVCPDAIAFAAAPGDTRVEIEIKEPAGLGFGAKEAYRWSLLEGGDATEENPLPGPPHLWAPLCEEIEANHEATGEKLPRRARKQLERCVRWRNLWQGIDEVPDRGTVRSRLERYGFRPVAVSE